MGDHVSVVAVQSEQIAAGSGGRRLRPHGPGTRQNDPLAQVVCRLGDASCASVHAEKLNRVTAQKPLRAPQSLLRLQRTYGNRFVQRVLELARESDSETEVAPEVEDAIRLARSGGRPLDSDVRRQMERAFGIDFSEVRVHTEADADALNRAVNARAFTTGQHIFFRRGEYNPGSSSGRELLAHELTHVVQQSAVCARCKSINSSMHKSGQIIRDLKKGTSLLFTMPFGLRAIRAETPQISKLCTECEKEMRKQPVEEEEERVRPKLTVGQPGDRYEQEADWVARAVTQWESRSTQSAAASRALNEGSNEVNALIIFPALNSIEKSRTVNGIQRIPAPGSNFGTYRYCGFGITTMIPGFIQQYVTEGFRLDYTTGCKEIWGNAWSSVWELYDSADRKLDENTEVPFGGYTIKADKINAGTPGEGGAKWSLWYRITRSQPWLTHDPNAYPYHYVTFDVYSLPIRNPNTRLREEVGNVIWQDNFAPGEDGASVEYNFSATASRTTTESQTTTVTGTIGGERSANLGFEFEGLTAGFANRLSYSATVSLSRTYSVSVQTSQTTSKRFSQPNLKRGVTYKFAARPLFHIIDGSVDVINHRDGVILRGAETISGGIRVLKGIDINVETEGAVAGGRWSCDAKCSIEGTEPHCTGHVEGHSSGHSSEEKACREAKRDATQKAPRGCYARHCRCFNCTNR